MPLVLPASLYVSFLKARRSILFQGRIEEFEVRGTLFPSFLFFFSFFSCLCVRACVFFFFFVANTSLRSCENFRFEKYNYADITVYRDDNFFSRFFFLFFFSFFFFIVDHYTSSNWFLKKYCQPAELTTLFSSKIK